MIQFVEAKNIDPKKWDDLIFASQGSTIFASYEFLSLSAILAQTEDIWRDVLRKNGYSYKDSNN